MNDADNVEVAQTEAPVDGIQSGVEDRPEWLPESWPPRSTRWLPRSNLFIQIFNIIFCLKANM